MAGLPLHDAILIENGVVSRVNRIAYAISHTQSLADMYRSEGVTGPLVRAAEQAAEAFRQEQYGNQGRDPANKNRFKGRVVGESPFAGLDKPERRAAFDKFFEGKEKKTPIVKVSKIGKRLIAAELGVLVAYDRGVQRKSTQSSQFGDRTKTAREINKVYKRDVKDKKGNIIHRAGEKVKSRVTSGKAMKSGRDNFADVSATRMGAVSDRWGSLSGSLASAGFDWHADELMIEDKSTGFKGYHAQAEDRGSDAWAVAKARLRQKYRKQGGPGWYDIPEMRAAYDAELGKLTALRRGAGVDKGYRRQESVYTHAASPKTRRSTRIKVKNNPFSDVGDLALTNPGTGVGFLDSIESGVSSFPMGEYVAPLIAPALLGAAAAGLHAVAVPKLKSYLPEAAQPYAYSVAGAAVAVAASIIAAKASDESTKNLAGLIGGAALAFGVGYDVNGYLERRMSGDKAGDDDFGALALGNDDEDYGAIALGQAPSALGALALGEAPSALGAIALGDGMAYQTAPLGFDGATSAIHAAYGDASLADAYFSGPDFDASEGEAIMAGAAAFGAAAGRPPKLASGARKAQSHYAGRQFHRWGWLIKQISFPALQQVAALPPDERLKVINELRSQALAFVSRAAEAAKAEQLAAKPLPAQAELAPQGAMAGYDMNGYGALVLAGGGY